MKKITIIVLLVLVIIIVFIINNNSKYELVENYKDINVTINLVDESFALVKNTELKEEVKDNMIKIVNAIDPYANKVIINQSPATEELIQYYIYTSVNSYNTCQISIDVTNNKITRVSMHNAHDVDFNKQYKEIIQSEEYISKLIKIFSNENINDFIKTDDKAHLKINYINEDTGTKIEIEYSNNGHVLLELNSNNISKNKIIYLNIKYYIKVIDFMFEIFISDATDIFIN